MNSTLNTDISHARSFICLGTGNSMKNKWAYILVCIIMCMCLCIIRCSIVESSHVPFVGNFNRCTYGQLSWSSKQKHSRTVCKCKSSPVVCFSGDMIKILIATNRNSCSKINNHLIRSQTLGVKNVN